MNILIKQDDNKNEDILELTGYSLIVLGYLKYFCEQTGLPLILTNVLNKYPESISETHPDGRAFDVSLKGWPEDLIKKCIIFLEDKCMHFAPISLRTGKPRLILRHDIGLGDHLHIQTKKY